MALIDREELLNKFKNTREAIDFVAEDKNVNKDYIRGQIMRLENCITEVKSMPVIEQKHAHWIKLDEDDYGDTYKCSNCNTCFYGVVDPDDSLCNFCLTCGAKMDEVTEDD